MASRMMALMMATGSVYGMPQAYWMLNRMMQRMAASRRAVRRPQFHASSATGTTNRKGKKMIGPARKSQQDITRAMQNSTRLSFHGYFSKKYSDGG